jgi:hypothetical protein
MPVAWAFRPYARKGGTRIEIRCHSPVFRSDAELRPAARDLREEARQMRCVVDRPIEVGDDQRAGNHTPPFALFQTLLAMLDSSSKRTARRA